MPIIAVLLAFCFFLSALAGPQTDNKATDIPFHLTNYQFSPAPSLGSGSGLTLSNNSSQQQSYWRISFKFKNVANKPVIKVLWSFQIENLTANNSIIKFKTKTKIKPDKDS